MKILPAIDLFEGKCVRLTQGDYHQVMVYAEKPEEVALTFQQLGATYLHIVDLNGAKEGSPQNQKTIKGILSKVCIPIQVGGGIRHIRDAKMLLDLGVDRIIIGTSAIEDISFLKSLVETYKDKIAVGIDAKDGFVQTRGWIKDTKIDSIVFIKQLELIGVKTIIYTDISKDGMLQGPNFEIYRKLSQMTHINIIASGGVSSLDDLKKLHEIGLYGAIVGKAYYEKKLDLKEAIQCLQEE